MIDYTEEQFELDIQTLAKQIREHELKLIRRNADSPPGYVAIHGVSPGGEIVAKALAKALSRPIRSKDSLNEAEHILIVDDLVITGATRDRYPDFDFACLHVRESAKPEKEINYAVGLVHDDTNISFFWDEKLSEDELIKAELLSPLTGERVNEIIAIIESKGLCIDSISLNIKRKQ